MEKQDLTNEEILKAFQKLRSKWSALESQIETKQEAAQREIDKKIVTDVSDYTVESIVKGLAGLQLDFNGSVEALSKNLAVEVKKLADLRQAITVETRHQEELQHIRVAADAFNILTQQNQEKLKIFELEAQKKRGTLENEITAAKLVSENEQAEYEASLKAQQEQRKNEREKKQAEYQYKQERQHQIDTDSHANKKKTFEQEFTDKAEELQEKWAAREKILADQKAEIETSKTLALAFPKELEDAVQKAKAAAIQDVLARAKVQAELLEKEDAANREIYALKIKSLEDVVKNQQLQVENISAQLQDALKQVQGLAMKTVESTRTIGHSLPAEMVK